MGVSFQRKASKNVTTHEKVPKKLWECPSVTLAPESAVRFIWDNSRGP